VLPEKSDKTGFGLVSEMLTTFFVYVCIIVGLIALDEVEDAVTSNVRDYVLIIPNVDRVSIALVNPFITSEIHG
jgi:hypothetical protein